MAVLANQVVGATPGGTPIVFQQVVSGDRVSPGARSFLLVRNGSGASINVTLDTTGVAFNSIAIPDTVIAVAAGATVAIPITSDYTSVADGLAAITYSSVTTVTAASVIFV